MARHVYGRYLFVNNIRPEFIQPVDDTRDGLLVSGYKFRGEYNKPDDFEESVLKRLETAQKGNTYFEEKQFGDTRVLRYMVPLYIERACLSCHGEPAGEMDISGRIKEGYKEGELRGAISVIVPFNCVLGNN